MVSNIFDNSLAFLSVVGVEKQYTFYHYEKGKNG